jgi:hypothetical protein
MSHATSADVTIGCDVDNHEGHLHGHNSFACELVWSRNSVDRILRNLRFDLGPGERWRIDWPRTNRGS